MTLTSACSLQREYDDIYYCKKLKFNCIKKNQLVIFKTSKGDFEVVLLGEDNPVTVANFIENIQNNIYQNKSFYKILQYSQVRLIQSGINPKKNYHVQKEILFDVRPSIPLEIKFKKENKIKYRYLTKEPSEIEDIKNSFQPGALAMIKSEERKSSSTEFFFVTNKIPELDGRYSIFGKIVKGFEVLEKITIKDFIHDIKISN